MRFTVVDVETANADLGSICQVGIARFEEGIQVAEWSTLIDPETYFDGFNTYLHGIDEDCVRGKPTFGDVAEEVRRWLEADLAVSYGHFDRVALGRAFDRCHGRPLSAAWLDCTRVVRRTWKDVARCGYGLQNTCERIGYSFKHHDALEDAKAAAHVLLSAMRETGLSIEDWLRRVEQPIDPDHTSDIRTPIEGNPDGDLYGEVMVFTGTLQMVRREAAEMAARVGCRVEPGVTKRTSMLVIGEPDFAKLAGNEKSAKQRKAEALTASGQRIRVLRESDFAEIVRTATKPVQRGGAASV